jgi:hypothetical protein
LISGVVSPGVGEFSGSYRKSRGICRKPRNLAKSRISWRTNFGRLRIHAKMLVEHDLVHKIQLVKRNTETHIS